MIDIFYFRGNKHLIPFTFMKRIELKIKHDKIAKDYLIYNIQQSSDFYYYILLYVAFAVNTGHDSFEK